MSGTSFTDTTSIKPALRIPFEMHTPYYLAIFLIFWSVFVPLILHSMWKSASDNNDSHRYMLLQELIYNARIFGYGEYFACYYNHGYPTIFFARSQSAIDTEINSYVADPPDILASGRYHTPRSIKTILEAFSIDEA